MLLIGFDSAWGQNNSGALVGILKLDDGTFEELGTHDTSPGAPKIVNYKEAEEVICHWQKERKPKTTLIMLDQPIIVNNISKQRPVENIVSSIIGKLGGGVQPSNTSNEAMFGEHAPVWSFLRKFGGPANPLSSVKGSRVWSLFRKFVVPTNPLLSVQGSRVFETYPVLVIIALGYEIVGDSLSPKIVKRLPNYNPNRGTFKINNSIHVCNKVSSAFKTHGLHGIADWVAEVAKNAKDGNDAKVSKYTQDGLDACLCLLVALLLVSGEDGLMVGDMSTGYMVVPYAKTLYDELEKRCNDTKRSPPEWLRTFKL